MGTVDSIAMANLRREPLSLFHMPTEIQLQIYEYVFADEPILWDRRHRDECNLRPTKKSAVEHPPWIWHRPIVDVTCPKNEQECSKNPCHELHAAQYTLAGTWKFCGCARRASLSLLRTNRHIFSIAAPMFWSKATFCFFDPLEFMACMRATSPGTRALMRGVSILSLNAHARADGRVLVRRRTHGGRLLDQRHTWYVHTMPAFWDTVLLLPGLERLGVPSRFAAHFDDKRPLRGPSLRDIAVGLPRLPELELTSLGFISPSMSESLLHGEEFRFWSTFYNHPNWSTFVAFSHRMDLRDIRDATVSVSERVREARRDSQLSGYVSDEVWFRLLPPGGRRWQLAGIFAGNPHADLVGAPRTTAVKTRVHETRDAATDPPDIAVTFHSLPLDDEALERSRLAKKKSTSGDAGGDRSDGGPKLKHVWQKERSRRRLMRQFACLRTIMSSSAAQSDCDAVPCNGSGGEEQEEKKKRKRTKKNRRGYRHR
ncbi:hypothetical protein PWT90_08012 [Aphanocladium album]|nr:hypothetical protein PWT90_08012 [Aphanocladium album]